MKSLLCFLTVTFLHLSTNFAYAAHDYDEGVKEIAKALADKAEKFQKKTLAVVNFDLAGKETELGRSLAEDISTALVMAGGLQIVDRSQLSKIFKEHELSMLGISGSIARLLKQELESPDAKQPDHKAVKAPVEKSISQPTRLRSYDPNLANAGRQIFNGRGTCWKCHGADAHIDRVEAKIWAMLNPKPTNLRNPDAPRAKTDEELFSVIKHGIRGTAMVSFKETLSDEQIRATIEYLHALQER